MDTSEFGGDRAHKERIVELSVGLFRTLGEFPKPVVAAINGPAVAGGFALALLCDVRIASTEARMGFLENRRGIPPSYAAARAALPAALATELCLTGRLLDAEEAERLGVVSDVQAPDELMPRAAAARGRDRRRAAERVDRDEAPDPDRAPDVLAAALRGRGAGAARSVARRLAARPAQCLRHGWRKPGASWRPA